MICPNWAVEKNKDEVEKMAVGKDLSVVSSK